MRRNSGVRTANSSWSARSSQTSADRVHLWRRNGESLYSASEVSGRPLFGGSSPRSQTWSVGCCVLANGDAQTIVQACIVHLIRNSLAFVSWKDRKAILPAIKAIYRAENAEMAMVRLEEFEAEWGKRSARLGAGPGSTSSRS
jgi:hypothetical protein